MPKVSFVVAVYGVAAYIERCVRSLYGQTLEDIEIVLVDDCSPDDSIDIALRALEEYPERKQQVKIVRHKENTGIHVVRRDGVRAATGEYVINIDGDDYAEERMAEAMYAKAKETDADIVLCGFWHYRNNNRRYFMPVPLNTLGDSEAMRDATLNRVGWPNVWCRMMKRELLMSDKMIWPVASNAEDVIITSVATFYAKKIAGVEEPLYNYYRYPNSMANGDSEEQRLKRFRAEEQNNQVLFRFFEQQGVSEKYQYGIIVNKARTRNELFPLMNKLKYCRLWRRTYPELNKVMLLGNGAFVSTYREKIWWLALTFGQGPRFRKYLLSKRLRPELVWRRGVERY